MAKSKKNKSKAKAKSAAQQEDQVQQDAAMERIVTMKALEEMSDSDGELPPEDEWDDEAKALKKAIEEGRFDALINNAEHGDEESIEEIALDDDDDDDDDEDEENEVSGKKKAASAAETEENRDDAEEDSEQEKEGEDESDEDDDEEEDDKSDDAKDEEPKVAKMRSDTKADEDEEDEDKNDTDEDEESEDEDENDEDDEDDEEDESPRKKAKTNGDGINEKNQVNSKALHVVTQELAAPKQNWPWPETFTVLSTTPLPFSASLSAEERVDIHDDLKREVAFYDVALEAALEARKRCKASRVPFSRPEDFFAEMVKTDAHMAKIKDRLIFENKKMDAVAQRKLNKEQKLRAKEAHSNKIAEKAKRKKDHFKAVEDWAQSAASQRGRRLADDNDAGYLQAMSNKQQQQGGPGPNKRRKAMDKKYGFGGKRGRFKQSDLKSLNDLSDYNPRGNFGGMGTKKTRSTSSSGGGGSGANRRGKRARDASRSRRKG